LPRTRAIGFEHFPLEIGICFGFRDSDFGFERRLMLTATNTTNATPVSLSAAVKVLLLGLGNDILTDDAIGLRVVRQLQSEFAGHEAVEVRETAEMGLALLDFLTGYSAVVIVDAIQTGKAPTGFIHEVDASSLRRLTGATPHFLGVGETLALGHQLGLPMPTLVKILAVEVEDPLTLGTEMTPALQVAFPSIVQRVEIVVRLALASC
jgi:hydrogenase maturation protease